MGTERKAHVSLARPKRGNARCAVVSGVVHAPPSLGACIVARSRARIATSWRMHRCAQPRAHRHVSAHASLRAAAHASPRLGARIIACSCA
eukprot:364235-Chlamydomonas_euryale.AAC.3